MFTPACRSRTGLDQITNHAEALYHEKCGFPLHRNRRRKGIGGNDECCNTGFVRSHVSPLPTISYTGASLSYPFFSWFNTRSSLTIVVLLWLGTISFTNKILSCERNANRDAKKRSIFLSLSIYSLCGFFNSLTFYICAVQCKFSSN